MFGVEREVRGEEWGGGVERPNPGSASDWKYVRMWLRPKDINPILVSKEDIFC